VQCRRHRYYRTPQILKLVSGEGATNVFEHISAYRYEVDT
jgi:hypothetical protein